MLDPSQIRAITLDLDDTLWPVWPTIRRAEEVLLQWLQQHAEQTAQLFTSPEALRAIRMQVEQERPELRHDLSGLRKASIAQALRQAGDDDALAAPAFDVFFAERQRVELFDDAVEALEFLSQRWPIVAITNGNADVYRMEIGQYFQDSFNVSRTGFAKPDVRIFQCAVDALQVPASAILHVGDDAQLDAAAARDAGMHAVWLNRAGQAWPITTAQPTATVRNLTDLCLLLQD